MRTLLATAAVTIALCVVAATSISAQQCDFTTTATNGQRAKHNYVVHNNRDRDVRYKITKVAKRTKGATQFESDNLIYSGIIPAHRTVELGYLSFATSKCQVGEADSSIQVTARSGLFRDTKTYSFHTTICTDCANQ